ncbi:MAG TPA: hypothetical protein ENG16_03925 [Archaeoglobus sp.]|nr:hypothetical protein [Archaeoglobus sp.]
MIEISWLGRGGQGVVFASRLLVNALIHEDKYCQSIIFFGAERRGAPVRAYNRIADHHIKYHHFVYNPDVAVVFTSELLGVVKIIDELKDGGLLIVNAPSIDVIKGYLPKNKCIRVGGCNATQIALDLGLEIAGLVVPNTAMLGAFSKLVGIPSLDSLLKAIEDTWKGRPKIVEKNTEAARMGYEQARMFREY